MLDHITGHGQRSTSSNRNTALPPTEKPKRGACAVMAIPHFVWVFVRSFVAPHLSMHLSFGIERSFLMSQPAPTGERGEEPRSSPVRAKQDGKEGPAMGGRFPLVPRHIFHSFPHFTPHSAVCAGPAKEHERIHSIGRNQRCSRSRHYCMSFSGMPTPPLKKRSL